MTSDVQTIIAVAAVTLALAVTALTVQLVLWRALHTAPTPADAPDSLVAGRGILPTALVAAASAATILLLTV
ncbi:MAG: hypothetical protein Q7T71_18935 [Herbiconiux sp.]|nr:hypothetical protein [Herbiconiux sp.]